MELKFKDKLGNIKYLLQEEDTEPIEMDKIADVLEDTIIPNVEPKDLD